MNVKISRAAARDLHDIANYIAQDSPLAAYKFVVYLRGKALQIGGLPHIYPLMPRYEKLGLGRRRCGNYLIVYRIQDSVVEIVRIIHGTRDIDGLLFPPD